MAMSSMVDEVRVLSAPAGATVTEVSEGLRIARYCMLDELPGLIFGVLTVAYIVFSMASLIL